MSETNIKPSDILIWIGLALTTAVALVLYLDWYEVAIKQQIEGYPFGGEGPVPYYYKNQYVYATNRLTWAIVFSVSLLFLMYALFTRNQKLHYVSFALTVLLVLGLIVNGWIGR
jgi:hypothetical protein